MKLLHFPFSSKLLNPATQQQYYSIDSTHTILSPSLSLLFHSPKSKTLKMSTCLDMSLDDIISINDLSDGGRSAYFRGRGRAPGSGSFHGPFRRFARYHHIGLQPYTVRSRMISPEPVMMRSEGPSAQTGIKLYISNLDYGVSNDDIKLLFSDVGELRGHSIHYDESGRSKGTAEVVFARQADALASIERYNNFQLDGKPMKIELVGVDLLPSPVPITSNSNLGSHKGSLSVRGRRYGSVHGRGFTRGLGRRRRGGEKLTAEELDADLERYHFEAMKIS